MSVTLPPRIDTNNDVRHFDYAMAWATFTCGSSLWVICP